MDFVRSDITYVRPFQFAPSAQIANQEFAWPDGPVDLEIGCGVGLHPLRYARDNPHRHLIAIERTTEKFQKFSRRLANHPQIQNLTAIHADACRWVSQFVPDASVELIFILYPNPNPNAKHVNQRWHAMPFFAKLCAALKPGGEMVMATNISGYAAEAADLIPRLWSLELIEQKILTAAANGLPGRTHFERKYLERGETCTQLVFRKSLDA